MSAVAFINVITLLLPCLLQFRDVPLARSTEVFLRFGRRRRWTA